MDPLALESASETESSEGAEGYPLQSAGPRRTWGKVAIAAGALLAVAAVTTWKTGKGGNTAAMSIEDLITAEEVPPNECGSEALSGHQNDGYRGCQNVARNGKVCQGWYTLIPNPHHYLPHVYAHKGIGIHNYCRNPSGSDSIWCYVTEAGWMGSRWEYCDPLQAGETSAPTPAPTSTATLPPPEPEATTTTTTISEEEQEEKEVVDENDAIDEGGEELPEGVNFTECFTKATICRDVNHGPARWPYCGFRLAANAEACQVECQNKPECQFFTWHHSLCHLLTFRGSQCYKMTSPNWLEFTSGPKWCEGQETGGGNSPE